MKVGNEDTVAIHEIAVAGSASGFNLTGKIYCFSVVAKAEGTAVEARRAVVAKLSCCISPQTVDGCHTEDVEQPPSVERCLVGKPAKPSVGTEHNRTAGAHNWRYFVEITGVERHWRNSI
jgi:hypothetical protein